MWFVRHPAGIAMVTFVQSTQILVLQGYENFAVTYFGVLGLSSGGGLSTVQTVALATFQLVALLALISYIRCIFTKPGKTPKLDSPIDVPLAQLNICAYCSQWKPPRTHHCRVCGVCIHRVVTTQMDHHCPWINNCVALRTHKFFLLFLLYFTVGAAMSACILGFVLSECVFSHCEDPSIQRLLASSAAIAAGLFFALLGTVLLLQQLANIAQNQLMLDDLQSSEPLSRSLTENLESVLGTNKWAWLLPLRPELKVDYREPLLRASALKSKPQTSFCCKAALSLAVLTLVVAAVVGAGIYAREYL